MGYRNRDYGELWPNQFEFRGSGYQVREIDFGEGSIPTFNLRITPSGNAFNKTFRLWIGDRKWSFADAEYISGSGYHRWLNQGGGQLEGDRLWVELVKDTSPLTARFTNVPEEHEGKSAFKVQVEFSDDITADQKDFPKAFDVTGGEIKKTSRVDGRKDLWKVTVEPDGTQDVTITLPGNRPCGTGGVPCSKTLDGKGHVPLANSPTTTVPGPVLASIADAAGTEGAGHPLVHRLPQQGG